MTQPHDPSNPQPGAVPPGAHQPGPVPSGPPAPANAAPGATQWNEWGAGNPAAGYVVPNQPPPVGARPTTLKVAVYLMIGGAVLTAVTALLLILALSTVPDDIVSQVTASVPSASLPPGLNDQTVKQGKAALTTFIIIGSLIGVALWLWMAWKNWQARGWARIVSTVLAALGLVQFLTGQPTGFLTMALGVAAVILLWVRSSAEYFDGVKAQQAAGGAHVR